MCVYTSILTPCCVRAVFQAPMALLDDPSPPLFFPIAGTHTGPRQALYQACLLASKRDLSLALFLLPYLVHSAAAGPHSSDAVAAIAAELKAVLGADGVTGANERFVAVQAVFGLLNVLSSWLTHAQQQHKAAAAQAGKGGGATLSLAPVVRWMCM